MRTLIWILLPILALTACRRQAKAPAWVRSAPAHSQAALSGQVEWILEQPAFQTLLAKHPLAEQSLDLFLKRARINPKGETGRITLYVGGIDTLKERRPEFLIRLGEFRDPKGLQTALVEAFPSESGPEGTLRFAGRELALHVVLDVNEIRIRALADPEGGLWLGELRSLRRLGEEGFLSPQHPVNSAAAWINGSAPFQGFLLPQAVMKELSGGLPAEMAKEVPKNLEAMAWSVTPGQAGSLHRMEIAFTGKPESIRQVTPWLQRLVAITDATHAGPPPELMQERNRVGLRCQLSSKQLGLVMGKLSHPTFSLEVSERK